ncbi:MAG: hypothetical protein V4527_18430 [Pseudomonadota bacterium]
MSAKPISMKELATRINEHLKRFERDPAINIDKSREKTGLHTYYNVSAYYAGGAKIGVVYIVYQNASNLSRSEATAYLEWLDVGNVGTHFTMKNSARKAP